MTPAKVFLIAVCVGSLLLSSEAALAQTDTPTPSTTPTETPTPNPTYTPFPLSGMIDLIGTPSEVPALSLTPKPWDTPTRPVPGAAFVPPVLMLGTPGTLENPQAHGFESISESNSLKLGRYVAEVSVAFYGWAQTNFPSVLRALRLFSFIVFFMAALMALFRRFAPDLASKVNTWRQGESLGEEEAIEQRVWQQEQRRLERARIARIERSARDRLGITAAREAERAARAAERAAKRAARRRP